MTALETRLRPSFEVDPLLTLRALWQGPGDPQMRFDASSVARATRTAAGPASVRIEVGADGLYVQAWGEGACAAIEELPDLLGARDEPSLFTPGHPLLRQLVHRFPGLRLPRTGRVYEALVPAIIGQKVTGLEARRSYARLARALGEPAPGPLGLWLPPTPRRLAAQPYWALHRFGLERRRADTLRRSAALADRLEDAARLRPVEARRRLLSIDGIGPWTVAETVRAAMGDPDAASVGDYNLPHLVAWALAGEARGSDARMVALLEPYAGQRARVVRLLELSGLRPPRFGPRLSPRAIAGL